LRNLTCGVTALYFAFFLASILADDRNRDFSLE
jgi:hypothetical protein